MIAASNETFQTLQQKLALTTALTVTLQGVSRFEKMAEGVREQNEIKNH